MPAQATELRELGPAFLGSRLKRVAELVQTSAARIAARSELPIQSGHFAILAALRKGPIALGDLARVIGLSQPAVTRSIGQLTGLDLVQTASGEDRRETIVSLTPKGIEAERTARERVWPGVEAAITALQAQIAGNFAEQLAVIEKRLVAQPLDERFAVLADPKLRLVEYTDAHAAAFREINVEWIEQMFALEAADLAVLDDPRCGILDDGGVILLAEAEGLGIIGTCALLNCGGSRFELAKMAVRGSARGLGAGRYLLNAAVMRARDLGAGELFLLSNWRCKAAVKLYERGGFVHDAEILGQFGADYARCDVGMRFAGWDK